MQVISCEKWSEFSGIIESIRNDYGRPSINGERADITMLFRGQSNSEWGLGTTLERTGCEDLSVETYLGTAYSVSEKMEALTGANWKLESIEENLDAIRYGDPGLVPKLLSYPYLVYLRHHGFPSPLLDWSLSEYVAAFFAFEKDKATDKVSIFVFIECPELAKLSLGWQANIHTYTHDVKTHCRHYAQGCQYTVATKLERELMTFCSHEEVFGRETRDQDLLLKIEIPRLARDEALKELGEKQISRKSLFNPEDVLMRQLAEGHFGEQAP